MFNTQRLMSMSNPSAGERGVLALTFGVGFRDSSQEGNTSGVLL